MKKKWTDIITLSPIPKATEAAEETVVIRVRKPDRKRAKSLALDTDMKIWELFKLLIDGYESQANEV